MGLGGKKESVQIHCPVDSLEGKKGLIGEDLFLLKESGLLMPSGLSIPHCLQPEGFLNTAWEREGEFILPSVKEENLGKYMSTRLFPLQDNVFYHAWISLCPSPVLLQWMAISQHFKAYTQIWLLATIPWSDGSA